MTSSSTLMNHRATLVGLPLFAHLFWLARTRAAGWTIPRLGVSWEIGHHYHLILPLLLGLGLGRL